MLKDCTSPAQPFALRVYHDFVGMTMRQGFHWTRYSRNGDSLKITDLKNPNVTISVVNKDVADRYERWFKWMLSTTRRGEVMGKRKKMLAEQLRRKIIALKSQGYSMSATAKHLECSYKHVRQICEQEVSND